MQNGAGSIAVVTDCLYLWESVLCGPYVVAFGLGRHSQAAGRGSLCLRDMWCRKKDRFSQVLAEWSYLPISGVEADDRSGVIQI